MRWHAGIREKGEAGIWVSHKGAGEDAMYTARCGCGGAKLEVEATEHEVWRSTPSRSAAAGGRRWAVGGSQWTTEMAWAKSRRRGEKGEGGVVLHLIGPWGTSCCLSLGSEGGGGWRRDMKSSDVSSCPQMRAFAKGDRPRFPRPRGDLGGGPPVHSSAPGAEGVIVFFFPPSTPSLCGLGCGAADSRGWHQR